MNLSPVLYSQLAYRAQFDEILSSDDISDMRAYIQQQRALGRKEL